MKYKISKHSVCYDTYCKGQCELFNTKATLSISFISRKISKHDLQPTLTPYIKTCDLLEVNKDKSNICLVTCPIFNDFKNSHSY